MCKFTSEASRPPLSPLTNQEEPVFSGIAQGLGLLGGPSGFASTSLSRPSLTVLTQCHLLSWSWVCACPFLGKEKNSCPPWLLPPGVCPGEVLTAGPIPLHAALLLPTMLFFGTNRIEPDCSNPLTESPPGEVGGAGA